MTVYVDELQVYMQKAVSGGRHFGSGKRSCHMFTDGEPEELHRFAERIGLRREWFQERERLPHYDLTPSKRRQAVTAGAVEVNLLEYMRRLRGREKSNDH